MPKQQYHHGTLRSALVREALVALENTGELPSWRALARVCGVSHSAAYRHFEGVDELRGAIAAEGYRRLSKRLRDATRRAPGPLAAFEAGVKAYVHFGLKHRRLYSLMFEQDATYAETAAASADAYGVLIGVLSGLGIRDPLRAGFVLWTAHHGLVDILCRNFDLGGVPKQTEARVALVLEMMKAFLSEELRCQRR